MNEFISPSPVDLRGRDTLAIPVVLVVGAIFGACQGLSYPLFSLLLERQGIDTATIGLNSAMTPLGIVAAAPLLPAAAHRIGAAATALLGALMLACVLLLLGAVQTLWLWFPLRFLLGFAICGLYVTSETWINVLAEPSRRGRMLGFFTTSLALGFACGPFILIATGSAGWPPFLALAGMVLVSAALLALVYRVLPNFDASEGGAVIGFARLAPLLLVLVLAVAAYDQGVLSLFPIYATGKGLGEPDIALAIAIWAAGNVLFQLPIGWLCDAWSRRGTTVLLCAVTVAGAAGLPFVMDQRWLLWPLLFVWGPASYGVYTVALIELGTRFAGPTLLAGNSAFAIMWGVGGMAGPPILGVAMDQIGPEGLPIGLCLVYGALIVATLRHGAGVASPADRPAT